MAVGNALQFAVVREDPAVELSLLEGAAGRRVLTVASGGDTALALAAAGASVTLIDPNPAQLAHTERKRAALHAHAAGDDERLRLFGVGKDDPSSLTGCGNFESLFRVFRGVIDDLVLPYADRSRALLTADRAQLTRMTASKYWPAAFAATFCDPLLEAMFGKDATQHAEPGSYPGYFQRRIEHAIAQPDIAENYFMHHFLLGHWVASALPAYLRAAAPPAPFQTEHATMQNARTFAGYDLISLSNIFDWMAAAEVNEVAARVAAEASPGARIVVRQLNNRAPIERAFGDRVVFRDGPADRSAFYERVLVGVKQ
jgi:S-adenosylmethionine-diacylglycerol 3-amino-3-carboxypropyl transferase